MTQITELHLILYMLFITYFIILPLLTLISIFI